MTFKLEDKEPFNESFRRIVAEQIDKAISTLSADSEDLDKSVHDARVSVKKIRALLRLVRHSLGKEIFNNQNKSFRDIARLLSPARNPAAMLEVVELIDEGTNDTETKALLQTIRLLMSKSKKSDEVERTAAMSEAQAELHKLKASTHDWPEISVDLSFEKGLRRVFRDGRTKFAEAYEAYTIEEFHEWRKQVKHLLYQTRILTPIWPGLMKAFLADLKTLGKLLSEDHDLALFRRMISEMHFDESQDSKSTDALFDLIDRRRARVEAKARSLGNRIYSEKSRAFAGRMHIYWKEWHQDVIK